MKNFRCKICGEEFEKMPMICPTPGCSNRNPAMWENIVSTSPEPLISVEEQRELDKIRDAERRRIENEEKEKQLRQQREAEIQRKKENEHEWLVEKQRYSEEQAAIQAQKQQQALDDKLRQLKDAYNGDQVNDDDPEINNENLASPFSGFNDFYNSNTPEPPSSEEKKGRKGIIAVLIILLLLLIAGFIWFIIGSRSDKTSNSKSSPIISTTTDPVATQSNTTTTEGEQDEYYARVTLTDDDDFLNVYMEWGIPDCGFMNGYPLQSIESVTLHYILLDGDQIVPSVDEIKNAYTISIESPKNRDSYNCRINRFGKYCMAMITVNYFSYNAAPRSFDSDISVW